MRCGRPISLFFLLAVGLCAQPYIAYRGIVNAASYVPAGLPNGAIARGSVFTIFGSGLGPAVPQQVSSFPLGTSFAGVSLSVTQGSTTVAAIPLFVSATQINAILPSNAPLGRVALRVTYDNRQSNSGYLQVAAVSPGLYSIYSGAGPGIFQNFVDPGNQPINSLLTTARPGQVVTLWGTGLGAVANDAVAPVAGDLAAPVEIHVGNIRANKLYSGRSPCCAGSDQIIFEIPASAPQGCYVPVTVIAGGIPSNTVTIAIHPQGQACTDPHNPLGDSSAAASSPRTAGLAIANLLRSSNRLQFSAYAHFERQSGEFRFNPLQALPPVNTCTSYAGKANFALSDFLPSLSSTGTALMAASQFLIDAFSLTQSKASAPFYFSQLSAPYLGTPQVDPAPSRISAAAGADVAAINTNLAKAPFPFPTPLKSLSAISRANPFTVTWTPDSVARPFIIVAGGAEDKPTNSASFFLCLAPAAAGRLTIPAYILASLPLAANNSRSKAAIAIGNVSTPASLNSSSLMSSVALMTAFDYQFVEVRP